MAQYATISEADTYFAGRLHTQPWDSADTATRNKALIQATRAIDDLRFIGVRHSVWLAQEAEAEADEILSAVADQELEFPRGSDEEVPEDIVIACCEEALSLLDGKDAEQELEDLSVVSQGYSSVRSTYDRTFSQEHLNAGIVSSRAWKKLKPYLQEGRDFRISRV